jgi:hypothetical protein
VTRKVKIQLDNRGRGTVEIDGQKIPNVRAMTFHSRVSDLPCLSLELIDVEVEIDAEAELVTTDVTTISSPGLTRHWAMLPKPEPAA